MQKTTITKRIQLRQIPENETKVMTHKWRNLLFLHWAYDAEEIQKTLPEGLFVDTFEDKAYVGIIPFSLYDVKPVFFPAIPFISDFHELNVRTYVYDENGTPGVWFYSLDANQLLAVKLAQQINLPYRYSEISTAADIQNGDISFSITRIDSLETYFSAFKFNYAGEDFFAESDSLEFFLVERYLLFCYDETSKRLSSIRVHHQPYPLRQPELKLWDDNFLRLNGFNVHGTEPDHIIVSPGVDVDIYNIKKQKVKF